MSLSEKSGKAFWKRRWSLKCLDRQKVRDADFKLREGMANNGCQINGLKQCIFIISQFLWVRNQAQLSWLMISCETIVKVSVRVWISSEGLTREVYPLLSSHSCWEHWVPWGLWTEGLHTLLTEWQASVFTMKGEMVAVEVQWTVHQEALWVLLLVCSECRTTWTAQSKAFNSILGGWGAQRRPAGFAETSFRTAAGSPYIWGPNLGPFAYHFIPSSTQ